MQLIPQLVGQYRRDAFAIIPIVSTNLSKLESGEQSVKYLDFLGKYISTFSEKGVKALSSLGLVLFSLPDASLLGEFEEKYPPKVLKNAEHAEEFIVKCAAAIHKIRNEFQSKYLALCMTAASQSFGSALHIASVLPEKLQQLEPSARGQYIDSFTRIVSKVGICAVGFCSGRLHGLFTRDSLEEAQKLVAIVCEIASTYGSVAAFDFLEKKAPSKTHLLMRCWDRPMSMKILIFILALLGVCILVLWIIPKL